MSKAQIHIEQDRKRISELREIISEKSEIGKRIDKYTLLQAVDLASKYLEAYSYLGDVLENSSE